MQLNCSSKAINKHFSSAKVLLSLRGSASLESIVRVTKMLSLSARQKTLLLSDQLAVLVCVRLCVSLCVCVRDNGWPNTWHDQ